MRLSSTARVVLFGSLLSLALSAPARAADWGDVVAPLIPPDDTYRAAGETLDTTTFRLINISGAPITANVLCILYRPLTGPDDLVYREFGEVLLPVTPYVDSFVTPIPPYMPDGMYLMRLLVVENGTGTLLATTTFQVVLGIAETCNGVDDDGDGDVDEGLDVDLDVDGWTVCDGDCDDTDDAIHPDAVEDCVDGLDNDCDGDVDALDADCVPCVDLDADGYEDEACGGLDCDDADAAIYPGAIELCDAVDNDCDGTVPEDEFDFDGDGYAPCEGDCDDADPFTYPGVVEDCGDGVDNDCDGDVDGADAECVVCGDADGDGYLDIACGGDDCDDADPDVHQGAVEYCGDGVDNDCDGSDAVCPAVGDLVISEIMKNPDAMPDEDGEWFEVTNVTGSDIDLQGLVISDLGTNYHEILMETIVPANGMAVLVRTDLAMAVWDYDFGGFGLTNGSDEVILSTLGGIVIDQVWYDGGLTYPDLTGASMALDPSIVGVLGAGMVGENWCEATSVYDTGDYGTPGLPNDTCP